MRWRAQGQLRGRRIGACVAGLCAYTACLLALAPAALVDAGLQRASGDRLRLAEAQGSLWSGAGQLEIRDTTGKTGVGRPFSWRLQPRSLLRGRLGFEIGIGEARFPVMLSLSRIELANADIRLPAAMLGVAVPRLAPFGLTGDVLIHAASLSLARDAIAGSAVVQWRAAGSALTPVSPLGDYEARLDSEGRTVHARLRTLEDGALRLDGTGSWTHGHRPAALAVARVAQRHQEQLAPLLRLIAVERADGSFELQLQ
jgi:general secretion pathway protein N